MVPLPDENVGSFLVWSPRQKMSFVTMAKSVRAKIGVIFNGDYANRPVLNYPKIAWASPALEFTTENTAFVRLSNFRWLRNWKSVCETPREGKSSRDCINQRARVHLPLFC